MSALRMISILLVGACTNADFYFATDPDAELLRARLKANVCAPPDLEEQVPYKILFVVDTSFSNSWTDPIPSDGGMPRREEAVRNAINDHLDAENVFFGVVTFSDEPRRQTFGYTRDPTVLGGAVANIATAQGGTNYSDTLWVVIDFVLDDFEQLEPVEASRTHYLVYWLSDGFPTVGVTDPASLTPGVAYLRDALAGDVAEFRFNTAFLGGGPEPATPEEEQLLEDAKSLLAQMAARGEGTFTDIPGGDSFSFDINPLPVVRRFVFATAVANNINTRFGSEHPLPDSDSDGIVDDEEARLDLDPSSYDSDGDGLGDGVELMVVAVGDPYTWDDRCPQPDLDTDGDRLRDCEEVLLGTNPNLADSDGDHLLDRVELYLGASPTKNDPTADSDLDGVNDDLEVQAHLAPQLLNTAREQERWSYRYTVTANNETSERCYRLDVENVSMYQTHGAGGEKRGTNLIELIVAFVPEDGITPVQFVRGEVTGRFVLPDYREPANGILELKADEFSPLP